MTAIQSNRYHALDALRGFALLLGVFYHAAESFVDDHWKWAIVDGNPSEVLEFLRHVSHCFRMEVFFLLAGFFANLLIVKRGMRPYAWNRFQRIVVPLVVGWLIIFPALMFLWILGALKSGNFTLVAIPEEARHLPAWKLWIGFLLQGGIVQFFSLGHLWFLHQLLVIYGLFLGSRAILLRLPVAERILQRSDIVFARIAESPFRTLILAVPTVGFLFLMDDWNVDTPMDSLIPHLPTTLHYGFCFTVGWWFYRQPSCIEKMTAGWMGSMLLGCVAVTATGFFFELSEVLGISGSPYGVRRLLYEILYALASWSFVFGFLGLFTKRLHGESRIWRYLAESSYWVYLIHILIVVLLQIWVAYWNVSWTVKYPIILLFALPTLYMSYHYLARSSFIGRQLNGRTWPFTALPPWLSRTRGASSESDSG